MSETTPAGNPAPWRAAPVAFWLAAGGLALWVLGVLLPWAHFGLQVDSPLGDSFERQVVDLFEAAFEPASGYDLGTNSGLEPDEGKITLVLALGFAVAMGVHLAGSLPGRILPIVMAAAAAVALVVVGAELTDLADATDVAGVVVDVRPGIWVSLVGTAAALSGGIAYAVRGPHALEEAPPAG